MGVRAEGKQVSPSGINRRHKKTGAVAGFSVYPGCIERHLESMFGAPREAVTCHIVRSLLFGYMVRDELGYTGCLGL